MARRETGLRLKTVIKNHQIYPGYKRQMEVYQWLLTQNNYKVSKTGYFLFAKVKKDRGFGSGKLSFDLFLEPQEGDISWVESSLSEAKKTLDSEIPKYNPDCLYCQFAKTQRGFTDV